MLCEAALLFPESEIRNSRKSWVSAEVLKSAYQSDSVVMVTTISSRADISSTDDFALRWDLKIYLTRSVNDGRANGLVVISVATYTGASSSSSSCPALALYMILNWVSQSRMNLHPAIYFF